MKRTLSVVILLVLLFSCNLSFAQSALGMQYFGSFGGGPFDNVNLGNLNTHFVIPIRHKAGRAGMSFSYDLNYDSDVWYPTNVNGSKTWQPYSSLVGGYWGWQGLIYPSGSTVTYQTSTSSGTCGQYNQYSWTSTSYTNWVDTDWTGSHPFNYTASYVQVSPGATNCPTPGAYPSTAPPVPAADKSGITLYAVATGPSSVSWNLVNPTGYFNFNPASATFQQDPNGNQITATGGVYKDTLGQQVLTVTGAPPTSSTTTFSYAAPSGATANYTVSYKTYTVTTSFGCSGVAEYSKPNVYLVDKITLPDQTSSYQFTYEQTAGQSSSTVVTARLAKVTLPSGGSITYTYGTANSGANNGINCTDGTAPAGTDTNPSLTRAVSPGGTWTYVRTQVSGNHWQTKVTSPGDPTTGNDTVIDFQKDGSVNTQDFFETYRLVYQGSSTSGTLLNSVITCYNAAGSPTPSSCPASTAVTSPIGRITSFPRLPDSTMVSETDITYGYISVPGYETEIDSYDYGATSPGSLLRKVVTTYNVFGNSIKPTNVQIQDGSGNVQASTTYSYDETSTTSTTSTPQHVAVTGGRGNLTTIATQASSTKTLYRKFTYYDTGMLKTSTSADLSSSTTCTSKPSICTTYNYNNTGTPSPSCGNSFVTSLSEPLSMSRSFAWDCGGGVMTSLTDENTQSAGTYYTGTNFGKSADTQYWRPYATTDQLNNPTILTYPNNSVVESALTFNGTSSTVDVRTKVDALGRVILSQTKEGPSIATYDSTQVDYDPLGRVSKSYLPFTNSADATCSGSCPGVTTTYDALYRPLSSTDGANGNVSYVYTNNDVLQKIGPAPTGENLKQKQLEYDGLGRLASVCEITNTLSGFGTCAQFNSYFGFWTKYTYNALGNMTGVTQNAQAAAASQQTRTYAYDRLGRMTSEQNPETGSSAITYTYDTADASCSSYSSAGDLVEKRDAMGNVTCMKYDVLHRVTQITYPSGSYASATPTKCYVYDTATVNSQAMANAKTRLAEAYTTSATSCPGTVTVDEGFSYSARGEVSDVWEKTPNSGGYYHVSATYWANGALNVLNGVSPNLPGLPTITYGKPDGTGMDPKGRITKVYAGTSTSLADPVTWNPSDQPTAITFGSSDNDTYQYDSNTGRMKKYQLNMGTGPTSQTGDLTWNTNGSLQKLQITDQINSANSQTCKFGDPSASVAGYDDLGRLIRADCGTPWSQTFSFDPFGNLSKSGSAAFGPTYTGASGTNTSPSNQYYQVPGGGTGASNYYDGNGNMKYDVTHSYTWDADGNMLSVDSSAVTVIYDALDRMAEQTRGSSHTQIVYGPDGLKLALMNGQAIGHGFVKLPAGGVAVYDNTGLIYYRHADHLGSSRLATKTDRTRQFDVAYAPYGEDYDNFGTTDLSFTGQNQDTISGTAQAWTSNLYDFLLREYRTGHGRWASPDPARMEAVDPAKPQSWNRYAYVVNNPLALIDPLGACTQISYIVSTWGFAGQTWTSVQIAGSQELYPGPCSNVPLCPNNMGAGFITGTNIFICAPPAALGSYLSQIEQLGGFQEKSNTEQKEKPKLKPVKPCSPEDMTKIIQHAQKTYMTQFAKTERNALGTATFVGCKAGILGCGLGVAAWLNNQPMILTGAALWASVEAYSEAFTNPTHLCE